MSEAKVEAIWRRLTVMAAMQDDHNRLVHPQWQRQGHAYYRAVWVECAELLDHFGWKWWKKQDVQLDQVKLEIVDIWHFGLSELLRAEQVDRNLAARLAALLDEPGLGEPSEFRLAVEALARSSLATQAFDLAAFVAVLRALPMRFDEMYAIYVGKNVLNAFRQQHGYRDGAYHKVWNGREDNEHLAELVQNMDTDAETFPADLARALAVRYAESRPA